VCYIRVVRIVFLLPSATEILFALGLDGEIVGVSHECDHPPQARSRRVVIRSRISNGAPPGDIDRMVREYVSRGESLYSVDAEALVELAPDLIVTQDLCHVCAASPDDLASALTRLSRPPRVLSLNPHNLADVWADIEKVGDATGRKERARALVTELEKCVAAVEAQVRRLEKSPRVALLEWLNPLYNGGHWVPEMIRLAGGEDVLGQEGKPSFPITPEQVIGAAPEVLLIAPCGYNARQARDEYLRTSFPLGWETISAVRDSRVFALEASGYFSRPGPRLAVGLEALAKIFHPAIKVSREAESAVLSLAGAKRSAQAASL